VGVEPLKIVLDPSRIIWTSNTIGDYMRMEIAAKMKIRKVYPMVEVVGGKIKKKRYIWANIGYGVCEKNGSTLMVI
jgi:hypothetical protein